MPAPGQRPVPGIVGGHPTPPVLQRKSEISRCPGLSAISLPDPSATAEPGWLGCSRSWAALRVQQRAPLQPHQGSHLLPVRLLLQLWRRPSTPPGHHLRRAMVQAAPHCSCLCSHSRAPCAGCHARDGDRHLPVLQPARGARPGRCRPSPSVLTAARLLTYQAFWARRTYTPSTCMPMGLPRLPRPTVC